MTGRRPKVTLEQYLLIRTRAAMGTKHAVLAKEYGITRQGIGRICKDGLKHYEANRAQP